MIRSAIPITLVRSPIRLLGKFSSSTTEKIAAVISSIERHGPRDAVIVLDVGGKEFKTLRSTIAANQVLRDIVERAEANAEFTQGGKAVFVDRDPTHFGLILQHLRNQVDGISYNSPYFRTVKHATVRLPTDDKLLRDIYLEAQFYGVQELMSNACKESVLAWIFQNVKGNSNPFDEVAKLIRRAKRILVGVLGFVGAGQMGSMLDKLPNSVSKLIAPEVQLLQELSGIDGEKSAKKKDLDPSV